MDSLDIQKKRANNTYVFGPLFLRVIDDGMAPQINERYWVHRRGSDAQSDVASLMASVHGSVVGDAFHEEHNEAPVIEISNAALACGYGK